MKLKRFLCLLLAAALLLTLAGCMPIDEPTETTWDFPTAPATEPTHETERPTETTAPATEATTEATEPVTEEPTTPTETEPQLDENGSYDSKDEVALYIHLYGHLPQNYITKKEAEKLGWQGGSLEPYAPGKCIGGSHFGNYEGLLPEAPGRSYTECDIGTMGKNSRGAKRIVFSNDGLIYYTGDHYESFELLYGGD